MKGYLKLYLASHDDTPHLEYYGEWANGFKRRKFMRKSRLYRIVFHMFSVDGQKAVESNTLIKKLPAGDLSSVIYELGCQMAEQYPDVLIDFGKSYAVVRDQNASIKADLLAHKKR